MKKKYFSLALAIVFLTTSDIKSEYKYEPLQTHIHTLDNGAKVHLSANIDKPHTQTKKPLIVTDDNYKKLLSGSKPVVLEFWAEWCGSSRVLEPIIDELVTKYEGRVVIGKVDFDINDDIVSEFGVRTIPTVLFFKGGKLVDKETLAAVNKDVLVEKINKLLKK